MPPLKAVFHTFWILSVGLFSLETPAQDKHYAATNVWQAEVGLGNQSSPALSADAATIYVTTSDGRLLACDTATGTQKWSFTIGMQSVSTPAVNARGEIVFGARNKKIYCVSAAGQLRWEFATGAWVDAAPALGTDEAVYCGAWDKQFYALNADGTLRWKFPTGGPVVSSAAVDAAGVIYFGSHDGKIYAVQPDGTRRWEFATGGAITASPALGLQGEIYLPSTDGKLHALNPDGTRRWGLHTGGMTPASPVVGADGTIFLSVNQTHCAISAAGKLLWRRNFWNAQPGGFGETAAAVRADQTVVFTGGDGYAMCVRDDRGGEDWIWNAWLFGRSYSAPLILAQGDVLVMSQAGKLWRLQQQVPPAQTPWPDFRGNPQRTGRAVAKN